MTGPYPATTECIAYDMRTEPIGDFIQTSGQQISDGYETGTPRMDCNLTKDFW